VAQTYGDQLGLTARVAGLPLQGSDWLVHVGVHGSYVVHPANVSGPSTTGQTAPSAEVVAFSAMPELRVDATKLINTGNIDASHADTMGLELALQKQNFLLQGEYEHIAVQRSDVRSTPSFPGYYVSATWVVLGGARKYNAATAAFDGPSVPHPFSLSGHGWGALELGLRYSRMDLNYHEGAPGAYATADAIRGGDAQILTAGANWYLNPVVRLMADFQHVHIDRLSPAATASSASTVWFAPAGAQVGQSYDVVSVRSQLAF
jgi:phosphate-selective porin OprO/OprP